MLEKGIMGFDKALGIGIIIASMGVGYGMATWPKEVQKSLMPQIYELHQAQDSVDLGLIRQIEGLDKRIRALENKKWWAFKK